MLLAVEDGQVKISPRRALSPPSARKSPGNGMTAALRPVFQ
jgi:hypothetical protein